MGGSPHSVRTEGAVHSLEGVLTRNYLCPAAGEKGKELITVGAGHGYRER